MYTHILLPTDGSALSDAAVLKGLRLARLLGARVSGLHVTPEFHVLTYRTDMLEDTREEFAADSKAHAEKYLANIVKAAKEESVPCHVEAVSSDHPADAIVRAAERLGCDLIVMASHGRRGAKGLLLGSETQKVLTHCKVPVLVVH